MSARHDLVTVTTTVAVDPATAFAIFTDEVELWWCRGPRHRFDPAGTGALRFERGPRGWIGGRLVETAGDGEHVIGVIRAWQPGARLAFEWRQRNFAADERTEVEVTFELADAGTRVTIEHRGWAAIRADHPARHGATGGAFIAQTGLWWAELATALRTFVARRTA